MGRDAKGGGEAAGADVMGDFWTLAGLACIVFASFAVLALII
jgi:hypothetical protein